MAPIPRILGDFAVLPVTIPPLPSFPKEATHHLYLRRNAPKIPTETDSRSLFIANVPVDSTEEHIRAVILALVGAGRFEGITFENESKHGNTASDNLPGHAAKLAALTKKRKRGSDSAQRADEVAAAKLPLVWARPLRRSGSTAVVLMADDKSVDLVLKAVDKVHKTRKFPVWGQGVPESTPGLGSKWLRAHQKLSYPDADLLQASVDAFFTLFNQHEIEAAELAKRLRSEPDEDGFVTVTRGSRTAPAKQGEAEEARRKMLEKEEKKKNELGNFYRFQHRERRKAEQADLLRRFEEDKKKVAAFREKRSKFRPES